MSNMTEFNVGDFNGFFYKDFEEVMATQLMDISTQQLNTQLKKIVHVSNVIMWQ